MPLNPIRFQSAQDILAFFKRLEDSGLVSFEKTASGHSYVTSTEESTPNLILQSSNGEFYYTKEVKDYLENNAEENSNLRFLSTKKGLASVSDLKENPALFEHLYYLPPIVFNGCSPNLYSDPREITLDTLEQIQRFRQFFSKPSHMQATQFVQSMDQLRINKWQDWTHWDGKLPLAPAKQFISSMYQDFLKITFFQQCQLQKHIMNAMAEVEEKDIKEELLLWKEELSQNNKTIKKFLETKIEILKAHKNKVEITRKMYQDFLASGLSQKKIQEELILLKDELEQETEKLEQKSRPKEKRRAFFKAAAFIGTLIILAIAAHLILIPTTIIFFPSIFIYALGFTLFTTMVGGIIAARIGKAIVNVDHTKEKRLSDELEHLELANKVFRWGSSVKENAFKALDKHDDVIKSLEEDLGEMTQYERKIHKIMNKKPSIFSFNFHSNFFNKGNKYSENKESFSKNFNIN